jgi:hypothetical protein
MAQARDSHGRFIAGAGAGGVQVIDRGWQRILHEATKPGTKAVKVGIIAGQGEGDADRDGVTNADLGLIHEFGTATVPERSWLRRTFRNAPWLPKFVGALAKQVLSGKMTEDKALEILGMKGATEAKKTITAGDPIPPPNAPATIRAKGSSRPLVDTGQMVNAISFQVVTV